LKYYWAKSSTKVEKNFKITGGFAMSIREKLERIMMAITFAESGEHDTAREFLREEKRARKSKRVRRRPRPELRAPSAKR
jgi:hypothetical protein